MSKIYTIEYLTYLRDSPLVLRPPGLPPSEQWMGLANDTARNINKPVDKIFWSYNSNALLDSVTRRSILEKHSPPRNNANSEEPTHAHPKNSSLSATSNRNTDKNVNSPDRLGILDTTFGTKAKTKINESDRGYENRNNRSNLIRTKRLEAEKGNEGWSGPTRKSFGEDLERFTNRSGVDRDRVFKDREDHDGKERFWGSNTLNRDKTIDNDQHRDRERGHRNGGLGRGRNEISWLKDKDNHELSSGSKNRHLNENFADRSRGWRGREKEERFDNRREKFTDKIRDKPDQSDRRWDRNRDHRHQNEPEWMEDPGEERQQVHTLEDFEKWKEQMQGKDKIAKIEAEDKSSDNHKLSFTEEKSKVEIPLDLDPGVDKFLDLNSSKEENTSDSIVKSVSEGTVKPKTFGKASRFTSFFNIQEESQKNSLESSSTAQQFSSNGLKSPFNASAQSEIEKEAFQQLLQKLQRQTLQASNPITLQNVAPQLQPTIPERVSGIDTLSQEIYQNHPIEHQDEGRTNTRLSQQPFQELFSQRQMAESQNLIRPEQILQDLISQRQNVLGSNSSRDDQNSSREINTEFLMGLMQGGKSAPESRRSEPIHLEMQPKSEKRPISKNTTMDLEQEIKRENMTHPERNVPDRHTRPQPPPGFFDDSSYPQSSALLLDRQSGHPQPAQILQQSPLLGLDMNWERQAQLPLQQHRHVQNLAPPPGLANNLSRVMPIPHQAFLPGFTMGNFPPLDVMSVSPQNIQIQPPPGFFNGPPHGFLPPTIGGFQVPENMAYGAAPFDGRRPPSQGTFRR
ncbi:hypothetical protein EV44_g2096 [Erysiphe necator]|uniref:Uncharacterized protein n=1 Tax=Uncinula necator TaxID=52586 RepID=A0A0B1PF41_UNCNE|nr:hypothetical protein EV44_g2096 [Erysiphe necator]